MPHYDFRIQRRMPVTELGSCLIAPASDSESLIDFRGLHNCVPLVVATAASLSLSAASEGLRVRLLGPRDPAVAHELARMQLGKFVEALGGVHDLGKAPTSIGTQIDLLPVTAFTREDEVDDVAARAFDAASAGALNVERCGAVFRCVAEAAQNVPQHAQCVSGGVVVARRSPDGHRFVFAVADAGRGIFESLHDHQPIDASDAALMSFRRGVSEFQHPGHGKGLADVVASVQKYDGDLWLATADAQVRSARRQEGILVKRAIPGTVIQGHVLTPLYARRNQGYTGRSR